MNRPVILNRRSGTRDLITSAFTALVFSDGFESVSVKRVVRAAGISRSTFYEYFAGKEDVLRACMTGFFEVVADCITADDPPAELVRVLDHLWQNRRLADAIFSGQARVVLVRNQTDLIEVRLRQLAQGQTLSLPPRLAAAGLAEAQLTMIETWLRGRVHCKDSELAIGLHQTSRASALALKPA